MNAWMDEYINHLTNLSNAAGWRQRDVAFKAAPRPDFDHSCEAAIMHNLRPDQKHQ